MNVPFMKIEKLGRHLPPPLKRIIKPLYRLLRGPTKGDRYDSLTSEIIAKVLRRDSNAIDVGSHRGEILDIMLMHAPNGRHYAFEPLPAYATALRRKYRANSNVKVFDCALSDSVGRSTFQYNVTSPDYSGIKRRTYDRGDTRIQQIEVALATLDSIVSSGELISLIKIDVEGAEYQVVRGARRVINEGQPVIIFEHGIGGADHYDTTPAMIFDLFSSLDYQLFALDTSIETALTREEMIAQFDLALNHYFCGIPKGHSRPF
jgi:FkbM family methyltransferase